jgi:hypothetical protein
MNYPYDQPNWFVGTQDYYCRMSKYGYMPPAPYDYIIKEGKCAFIDGSTKRIFQKEYEEYKAATSPY